MMTLLALIAIYLLSGLGMYVYAVYKSYELSGIWYFNITKTHVSLCKYPKWMLYWLYLAVSYANKKWKRLKHVQQ